MNAEPTRSHCPLSDLAGTELGGFRIISRLSNGGFGTVYRAYDPNDREVAIKVLHADLATNRVDVARFEREAKAVASLDHPGIVEVLATGCTTDGRPWFAMELLVGYELEELVCQKRGCTPVECLTILRAIADALTVAHASKIIHRDIKATNVFVARDEDRERIVLLDFGIAKLLDVGHETLTATGTTLGTPGSMAPEQSLGGPVDARTDVYALGALLFHMLTGKRPFGEGRAIDELRFLHQRARRPQVSEYAAVPSTFDLIVMKAMAIAPQDRYRTPSALVDAFEQALVGAEVSVITTCREARLYTLLDISAVDDSLAAPCDALWADLEAIREMFGELTRQVIMATDTTILASRPIDCQENTVQRALEETNSIAATLRARASAHPSLRLQLILDVSPPTTAEPLRDEAVAMIVSSQLLAAAG